MSKLPRRIALAVASLSIVGVLACSAAPGSDDASSSESAAIRQWCGSPQCTCWDGSTNLATDNSCGKALWAAHCTGGDGTSTAYPWSEGSGGPWFLAVCPAGTAIPAACKPQPYVARDLGSNPDPACVADVYPKIYIEFDPNCPGCHPAI
jgi:hypothetical protein